jgi:membrane fusion protein, copper/silver efflux system
VSARNFIKYPCKWLLLLLAAGYGWTCSAPETSSGGHAAHPTNAQEQNQLDLGEIVRPTEQVVISNQATVKPAFLRSATRIPVQGYITYDPRRHNQVAARVGGRIEKLYVRYQNQYIQKGDKIMALYSPELNTYQDEFLYLIRSGADPVLQEQSREKLSLLGISRAQISRLARTGEHAAAITIYSPYQGYITWTTAEGPPAMATSAGPSAGVMGTMASASSPPAYRTAAEEPLREGAYVNAGQTLFSVNDLNAVWAILAFETRFLPDVQVQGAVELRSEMLPERPLVSSVGFLEPIFQKEQKFTQARAYLPNGKHQLKINSLVSGFILPAPQPALVVPATSVYDVGRRKIVWVYQGKTPGGNKRFQAREIIAGAQQGDSIQIIRGLEPQEEIAREAGYLVDSESFIQPTSR